ncbi:MAG: right-handed parallel beta-helix repeat-containing protein [Candidatus Micrarchaeia archaeon]
MTEHGSQAVSLVQVRLLAIFLLAAASLSFSANCGGAVPCACGDTLIASWTMASDLGPCSGNGLTIGASGITLDCAGHSITGTGAGNGIISNEANLVIKNCTIQNFYTGLNFVDTHDNTIVDIHFHKNNYSLRLHNAYNNNITNIDIAGGEEGVRISYGHGNILRGLNINNITESSGIGLYLYLTYNNSIANINITNALWVVYIYNAQDNVLEGLDISNITTELFVFNRATNNTIANSSARGGSNTIYSTQGSSNTLINTSTMERGGLNLSAIANDLTSNLTVKWHARVRVLDVRGMGVSDAAVNVSDALGRLEFQGTTDANGFTPWFVSNDSVLGYGAVDFNNHTINASKNPFTTTTAKITSTQTIEITLNYMPFSSEPRNEREWPMFRRFLNHTGWTNSSAPNTNATLWVYNTGGQVESSPAVADGIVYVGSYDNKTYALNATTGELIWSYMTGGPVYSSPAVADGKVYVGSWDKNVYALNASTGGLIWKYTTGDIVDSSPAVADGKVYVGSVDKNVYALNASTGELIWSFATGWYVYSSPAVADGIVYVGSDDDRVYALNASTGELIWNYTTGYNIRSSPAVADGKVYVGSGDKKVYALNATTGELIWSYTTGGVVISSPAVADGKVYVGSRDGKIYAFGPSHCDSCASCTALLGIPNSNVSLTADISAEGTCIAVGANNTTFDCAGHTITGNGSGIGVNATGRANIEIRNCRVTNFTKGIDATYSQNTSIINNTVFNNTVYGIVAGGFNVSVINNTAFSQTGTGGWPYGEGIDVSFASFARVIGNVIYNNTGNGLMINIVNHSLIANNTIHHNGRGPYGRLGLVVDYGENHTIAGNILYDNNNSQMHLVVVYDPAIDKFLKDTMIANNTIFETPDRLGPSWGIRIAGYEGIPNVTVFNNTLENISAVGISFDNVTDSVIADNTLYNATTAVSLSRARGITVSANRINVTNLALGLNTADNNSIANINITNALRGVSIYNAQGNVLEGLDISNITTELFVFYNATNNTIANSSARGGSNDISSSAGSSNTLINTSTMEGGGLNTSAIVNDFDSNLTVKWFVRVNVTKGGSAVSGANANATDVFGSATDMGTTDANGLTNWFLLNDTIYRNETLSNITYNPYTFSANKSGSSAFVIDEVNATKTVDVKLGESCGSVGESLTLTRDINASGTCFVISAPNVVFDCAGHKIIGNGSGYGIVSSGSAPGGTPISTNLTVKNCWIENFTLGMAIAGLGESDTTLAYNVTIFNNSVFNSTGDQAVALTYIANSLIANNTVRNVTNITFTGDTCSGKIHLHRSYNVVMENNTLLSGRWNGIALSGVYYSTIRNNYALDNYHSGIHTCHVWAGHNNITGNTIVGSGAYGISAVLAHHYTITNNNISDINGFGIHIGGYTYANRIEGNNVTRVSGWSVCANIGWETASYDNTFVGNRLSNCGGGVWLKHSGTTNNTVENNVLSNTYGWGAIYVTENASNNTIRNNAIENARIGIRLENAHSNSFSNINITNVTGNTKTYVTYIKDSTGNVFENILARDVDGPYGSFGVYFDSSHNNTFELLNITNLNSTDAGSFLFFTNSQNNTVANSTVRFFGSWQNEIISQINSANTLVNTSTLEGGGLNRSAIANDLTSNLTVKWFARVNVTRAGVPVAGADVNLTDAFGLLVINASTDSNGLTHGGAYNLTTQAILHSDPSEDINFNPHTVAANYSDYPLVERLETINSTRTINVDFAASCGRISDNWSLVQDISASGNCFPINCDDCVFDCAGHKIIGNGSGAAFNLTGRHNVTIKNCIIANFTWGIYSYLSNASKFLNNTILNISGVGEDTAGMLIYAPPGRFSTDNIIADNSFYNTSYAAVHAWRQVNFVMQNNSAGRSYYGFRLVALNQSAVAGNTVRDAGIGIWSYEATSTNFTDNALYDITAHPFAMFFSTDNRIDNLAIGNSSLEGLIVSDSSRNVFSNIELTSILSRAVWMLASENNSFYNLTTSNASYGVYAENAVGNNFTNTNITNAATALYFFNATNNTLFDSALEGIAGVDSTMGSANSLANTSFNRSAIANDPTSNLSIWWYVRVRTLHMGAPVADSEVRLNNSAGQLVFDELTDGDGYTPYGLVLEGIVRNETAGNITFNPFALTANKTGLASITRSETINATETIVVEYGSSCGAVYTNWTLAEDVVANGTCFTIGAPNIVFDCAGHKIIGNGSGVGIDAYNNSLKATNLTIKNCWIENFAEGIRVAGRIGDFSNRARNVTILNNSIFNMTGYFGIDLDYVIYSTVANNTLYNTSPIGQSNAGQLGVAHSDHVEVSGNNATLSNRNGIVLAWVNNITVRENYAASNGFGGVHCAFVPCTNSLIANNTLVSNSWGVGLTIGWSSGNIIANNTILDSRGAGIMFAEGVHDNIIVGNNITRVWGRSTCITLYGRWVWPDKGAHNNVIANNTLAGCAQGIELWENATNNTIEGNNIFAVSAVRLLSGAHNNTIRNNTIGWVRNAVLLSSDTHDNLVDNLNIVNATLDWHSNLFYLYNTTANILQHIIVQRFDARSFNGVVGYFDGAENNTIDGLIVEEFNATSSGSRFLFFSNSRNNTIANSSVYLVGAYGDGVVSQMDSANTLLNTSTLVGGGLNRSAIVNDPTSNLTAKWFVRVNVTDADTGATLQNVVVNLTDLYGNITIYENTSASGLTNYALANDSIFYATYEYTYNNHTLMVEKSPYYPYSGSHNITSTRTIDVALLRADACRVIRGDYHLITNVTALEDCFAFDCDNCVFDCRGHAIIGPGSGSGFSLFNRRNVTIKNCIIANFTNAIHLNNTEDSLLLNNTAYNNTLGFHLNNSRANRLEENTLRNNYHGVRIENSQENSLRANAFLDNIFEGLRLQSASGNNVSENVFGNNTDNIVLASSVSNALSQNTLANASRGLVLLASSGNSLTLLNITNNTVGIYAESSTANVFDYVNITDSNTAVFLNASQNNLVANSSISASLAFSSVLASNNTALNTSFDRDAVYDDADSNLTVQWFVRVNVTNGDTISPIYQARVNLSDVNNRTVIDALTNPQGLTDWARATEIIIGNATNVSFNNHSLNVTKRQYIPFFGSFNIIGSQTINVSIINGTACRVINTDYTLTGDVYASAGDCFTINASDITIDCAGYRVIGAGWGFGFNVTDKTNITIKNCIILDFNVGIRFRNASASLLLNDSLHNNTRGIYASEGSDHNRMFDIVANSSPDAGVLIEGSRNATLANISAFLNGYGVQLVATEDDSISNASIYNNSFEGLVLVNVNHTVASGLLLENNTLYGIDLINVRNASLANITLSASELGVRLQGASGNNFTNASITANQSVWAMASQNNLFVNSSLAGATYDFSSLLGSNNTILNVSFGRKLFFDSVSNLTIQWYVRANVTNSSIAVEGAEANLTDTLGKTTELGTTDASGLTGWHIATEAIARQADSIMLTPHTLRAAKGADSVTNRHYINISKTLPIDFAASCGSFASNRTLVADINASGDCFAAAADDITLDCAGHALVGNGSGIAVNVSGRDNVTVRNCIITNFTHGILFSGSVNGTALNNTIYNNSHNALVYESSEDGSALYNYIQDNGGYGILVYASPRASIAHNILYNNWGTIGGEAANIHLRFSPDGVVYNNTAERDYQNIYVYYSPRAVVANNSVANATGWASIHVRGFIEHNTTVENNTIYGDVGIVFSHGRRGSIRNNTLSNAGIRIEGLDLSSYVIEGNAIVGGGVISYASDSTIANNSVANAADAFTLLSATNVTLANNTAVNASGAAYRLISTNNAMLSNLLASNASTGLYISASNQVRAENVSLMGVVGGVNVSGSRNNVLIGLSIADAGIAFALDDGSAGNLIANSTITNATLDFSSTAASGNNTALNVSLNKSNLYNDFDSNLTLAWYVRVEVRNGTSYVAGATANLTDAFGSLALYQDTGIDGRTGWAVAWESIVGNTTNISFNPHNLRVNKTEYPVVERPENITASRTIIVNFATSCGTLYSNWSLDSDLNASGDCFTIGASELTLDCAGHTITGNGSGVGIGVENRANVEIRNCRVTNFTYGILALSNVNLSVINNTAFNNDLIGIAAAGLNISIINNTAFGQTGAGGSPYGEGIHVGVGTSVASVINNTIYGNPGNGLMVNMANHTLILNNTIHNNSFGPHARHGLDINHGINHTVAGNILYDNKNGQIYINALPSRLVSDVIIANNTIFESAGHPNPGSGIIITASGGVIENAVVYNNALRNISAEGILFSAATGSVLNNTIADAQIGIAFANTHNSAAIDNAISNASIALRLSGARNNSFANISIANATGWAARLESSSNNIFTGINADLSPGVDFSGSHGNVFERLNITNTTGYFLRFADSAGNTVVNSSGEGEIDSRLGSANLLLNTSTLEGGGVNRSAVYNDFDSNLTIAWYVRANATLGGAPVAGATINLTDVFDSVVLLNDTGADGLTAWAVATERVARNASWGDVVFNPHTARANKSGLPKLRQTELINSTRTINMEFSAGCGELRDGVLVISDDIEVWGDCFVLGDNALVDCAGHAIVGVGSGTAFNVTNAHNVTVRNCIIKNFTHAILSDHSSASRYLNNTMAFNQYGVRAGGSRDNLAANNTIFNSSAFAVMLESDSDNNVFYNNTIYFNPYGFAVLGGSDANRLERNNLYNNAFAVYAAGADGQTIVANAIENSSSGAIVLTGSPGSTISQNIISGGLLMDLYADSSDGLVLERNTLMGCSAYGGMRISASNGITVSGNSLFGCHMQLGAMSGARVSDNAMWDGGMAIADHIGSTFDNNTMSNYLVGLDVYRSANISFANMSVRNSSTAVYVRSTTGSNFTGLAVNNASVRAILFENAQNNLVANSSITDAALAFESWGGSHNTALNVSFDKSLIANDFSSNLTVAWYVRGNVTSHFGNPVEGASFVLTDANGDLVFSALTDASGLTGWGIAREGIWREADIVTFNNHTASASWWPYGPNASSVNITASGTLNVTLVLDLGPPTIWSVGITPNPTHNSTPLAITANITDDTAVQAVNATLRNLFGGVVFAGAMSLNATTGLYEVWTNAPASEGFYRLNVTANDTANNLAWDDSTYLIVDDTPPSIRWVSVAPNPARSSDTLNISANITDPLSGVAAANATLNGSAFALARIGFTPVWQNASVPAPPAEGNYTVNVSAADRVGNLAWNDSGVLVIDNTPPYVWDVVVLPNAMRTNAPFVVSAKAADNIAVAAVWLELNGVNYTMAFNNNTDRWENDSLTAPPLEGAYNITVWANDTAGNLGFNDTGRLIADDTPPAILAMYVIPNPVYSRERIDITVLASDNLAGVVDVVLRGEHNYLMEIEGMDYETKTTFHLARNVYGEWVASHIVRSQTGTYPTNITATDAAGNSVQVEGENITIISRPLPPGKPREPRFLLINITNNCMGRNTTISVASQPGAGSPAQPIAGAGVRVIMQTPRGWEVVAEGTTDEAGQFVFVPARFGRYEVGVVAPFYVPATEQFRIVECAKLCRYDIECPTGLCRFGECASCLDDSECATGLCVAGFCTPCTMASQCASGLCVGGRCRPCTSDSQCTTNLCINGTCTRCKADWECATGECINGICSRCKRANAFCQSNDECCIGYCANERCAACLPDQFTCTSGTECCSGTCFQGVCTRCISDFQCPVGYCDRQSGRCKCRPEDLNCLAQLGPAALGEPLNITPPQPPINITLPMPEPCAKGTWCASDADCCGGKCVNNVCVCRMSGCRSTEECCEGYCAGGVCLTAPPPAMVPVLQGVLQLPHGCYGLIDKCTFMGCIELCWGIWLLLILTALAAGYMALGEENRLVPVAMAIFPLLVGALTYPIVGVLVAVIEIIFFYLATRKEYAVI